MAVLAVISQETRENRLIATKTRKNGAHARNTELMPIKWSLHHPESIARNCVQNEVQNNEKQLKNHITFLIENLYIQQPFYQIPQKYDQTNKI